MGCGGLKLELIEWLAKLEDGETIQYLKVVKDSKPGDQNWWDNLDAAQKKGIVGIFANYGSRGAEYYMGLLPEE